MEKRPFGVSTSLYRQQRLTRDHLLEIGAHGFDGVELDAHEGHFDPSNELAVAELQQWLADARLDLHAVVAPPPDGPRPWNASALGPVEAALHIARRIPFDVLVVPVGSAKSASKAMERLAPMAEPLGVTIAVDSRSASMTPIGSAVTFVERCDARIGIALDFAGHRGSAALVDEIETASEHLAAARLPAESGIDWPAVMTTVQKVGYEGPFIIDAAGASPQAALKTARATRERLERLLAG